MIKQRKIIKVANDKKQLIYDDMVEEKKMLLYANDVLINEFVCLEESVEELALGFMVDQGLLNSIQQVKGYQRTNDVVEIKYYERKRENESLIKETLDLSIVNEIMNDFNTGSPLFQKTGAIHTYGIYDGEKRIIIKEDVGRHNALDKMIGYALKNNIGLHNKIIITSGRLTYEIANKLSKHPIKAIISISTPSINALKMFEKTNVTVIGFARNSRFNVYTNLELHR